jgi:hypothetical protein
LTKTDAMREACTTIQTIYDPMVDPRAADAKKVTLRPEKRKPVTKKTTDPVLVTMSLTCRRTSAGLACFG